MKFALLAALATIAVFPAVQSANCRVTCSADMTTGICFLTVNTYNSQYCNPSNPSPYNGLFTRINNNQFTCGASGLLCNDATSTSLCNGVLSIVNTYCGSCNATITDCSSSDSGCFPATATVALENGSAKRMDQLAVGDKVLTRDNSFSAVYMFSHKMSAARVEFVHIETVGGRAITLTGNHYLYVNDTMAVASVVTVGDSLTTTTGPDAVVGVSRVWDEGLYNPHTMHGDIVVDGILTSTYTSDIDPTLAHAALWPVRMLHSMGKDVVGDAFADGSDLVAAIMPDGKKKY